MSQLQLLGFLGLVAIAACWALAVLLYRVGAPGGVARKLSLLLAVEGFTLATAGYPEYSVGISLTEEFLELHPLYTRLAFIAHSIGDAAMFALYPPFLAVAIQTKLTRPFGTKRVRIGLWIAAVAMVIATQLSSFEVGATILYGSLSLLFGFALVAAIHAWFVADGDNRVRARAFVFAFGLRDICWGLVYSSAIWAVWAGTYFVGEGALDILIGTVYALGTLLAVPLIAYGILRAHLFDIDLRIQWTIKQSTLATVFVTLIFLISEGADRVLSAELGNFAGLFAAAVVVFFLAPLQRFAERVATVAMPNTKNTPEYVSFRKMRVYEEALTEALPDGMISDRERELLNRLRDSLGISTSDADAIESDLQAGATA